MVFTRCTPRLTIDNSLNELCHVFDEHAKPKLMAEYMVHKMELIAKSLLENIEQVQKKQRKVYATHKGLQIFDGFEENNEVKMCKPGKKKYLVCN